MDINILSPEELLNYAQPKTDLEIKLFDVAIYFQSEMQDLQFEISEFKRVNFIDD